MKNNPMDHKNITIRLSVKVEYELNELAKLYYKRRAEVLRDLIADRAKEEGIKFNGSERKD